MVECLCGLLKGGEALMKPEFKHQFMVDMNTNDVKKLTIASGCVDSFERLMNSCQSMVEVKNCKTALLRYIKDYQDERFKQSV